MIRISDTYSRAHRAFIDTAEAFVIAPMHVRILVELYDIGAEDGDVEYRAVDGGRARPGQRSQLTLQPAGTLVAEFFYARFAELAEGMVLADA